MSDDKVVNNYSSDLTKDVAIMNQIYYDLASDCKNEREFRERIHSKDWPISDENMVVNVYWK